MDHLHVNGIRNKYWEPDDSVVASVRACLTPLYRDADRIMPVAGSGMWAGQVPETYQRTGAVDLIYIAGGGIQGHPAGPGAGVRSIRQAWEAALAGISLEEYARDAPGAAPGDRALRAKVGRIHVILSGLTTRHCVAAMR